MQYRDFGQLDFRPSALGFGAMRLPVLTDDDGKPDFKRIDYPLATDDAAPRHRRRCELRRHRLDVPRGQLRGVARRGAQGRLPRAGPARHQDARVERREAVRLRPHPRHPDGAPADGPHRLLPAALPRRGALEVRGRAGPAGRRRACARRRPHRPPRLQLPRHLRGLRDHPRRHRPLGVRPDPVQLHGRGVPGRPQGAGAGGRQGPRRHRHGASARRRPGAQRAAAGAGRVGRGARQSGRPPSGRSSGCGATPRCRSCSAA